MKVDKARFKECCVPAEGDYLTGKYIFQPIGRFFARIFIHTPLTPNQITLFWGFLMVISALLFANGHYWHCVAGGVLWIVSYGMDYTDGIIARYKNMKSNNGEFLDQMVHRYTYPLLMTCIGWGIYATGGTEFINFDWFKNEYFILIGILAGVSISIFMSIVPLYNINSKSSSVSDKIGAKAVEGGFFKNPRTFDLVMSVNPLAFTNMMVLLLICALLNILWLFIIFYAIGYFAVTAVRAAMMYRKLRTPV